MQIIVEPGDWGDALLCDITRLLGDVSSHIEQTLREPIKGTVLVRLAPHYDWTPRTHIRSSTSDPFTIQLTAQGKLWAKFSYQFSHEFCHVLSGHERLKNNPNNWFHEAICELASVFTLRRMAESWPDNPPYPNWSDYAPSLADYAQNCLAKPERQLPTGLSLSSWLDKEEASLRPDEYQRDKNAIVAYALLPLFEDTPSGWNTIRFLPESNDTLSVYLHEWHTKAENIDAPFVERMLSILDSGRIRR